MRFGVIFILFLMLTTGIAGSFAWAHEGGAVQASPRGMVMDFVNSADAISKFSDIAHSVVDGDMSPDSRENHRPVSSHCFAFAGCGGLGVLTQPDYVPFPPSMGLEIMTSAGDRPYGVDLPREDRPPRPL